MTRRPQASLFDDPNSLSLAIWSWSKTGPSLQTLMSSMTQHPQTPAPHFMYLSNESWDLIPSSWQALYVK